MWLKKKIGKRVAGKNYTRTLMFLTMICGLGTSFSIFLQFSFVAGMIAVGFFGFFKLTFDLLHYVTATYVIAGGLLILIAIIPIPIWHKKSVEWFPFLHTFRGRGFYLLFLGSIECVSIKN